MIQSSKSPTFLNIMTPSFQKTSNSKSQVSKISNFEISKFWKIRISQVQDFLKSQILKVHIFNVFHFFQKKLGASLWPKEKCHVIWKWLWGKIYTLLYTHIFSCTWLWGEYTGYGKNIHIAMYYLNEKPDFRGSQGVRPLVSPIGTSSGL